mmetsp:Transcript_3809/g.8385  ORF Transcript_3809/g.8385 Transcript_3809/m.8385 type:complete len:294 (-) Transcript_3809:469-1350(-)
MLEETSRVRTRDSVATRPSSCWQWRAPRFPAARFEVRLPTWRRTAHRVRFGGGLWPPAQEQACADRRARVSGRSTRTTRGESPLSAAAHQSERAHSGNLQVHERPSDRTLDRTASSTCTKPPPRAAVARAHNTKSLWLARRPSFQPRAPPALSLTRPKTHHPRPPIATCPQPTQKSPPRAAFAVAFHAQTPAASSPAVRRTAATAALQARLLCCIALAHPIARTAPLQSPTRLKTAQTGALQAHRGRESRLKALGDRALLAGRAACLAKWRGTAILECTVRPNGGVRGTRELC